MAIRHDEELDRLMQSLYSEVPQDQQNISIYDYDNSDES